MKKSMLATSLVLLLSTNAFAASKVSDPTNYNFFPEITSAEFDDAEFKQIKKDWTKQNRKLASSMTFQNSDLTKDFTTLRDEWLKVKTGDEMENLLKISQTKFDTYSDDAKYFLAQMHLALPLRGIIWRLRPLFEVKDGFFGNKSSHVMAVQAVRNSITSLKMFLPTNQTDAVIQFFTEPSKEMSKADQFTSIASFQNFMSGTMAVKVNDAANSLSKLAKKSPSIYVWDNKMAFGRATFEDDLNRFVGHGPAEINFTIAALYRAYHDILVYCAYNQDYAIKLAGEIGSHFGVDSGILVSRSAELGMTDEERVKIVKAAVKDHNFLQLRSFKGADYGARLLKLAYTALKNSVVFSNRAYELLQGKEDSKAMVINPTFFQPDMAPRLDAGVKNMVAIVKEEAEVRDPVTGDTVTINLPKFYKEPPKSLGVLMANGFEKGDLEKTIVNNKGETLKVRNYLKGRSNSWNNNEWKKYVPSAAGQSANYMSEARRVIQYSKGTSLVFGLPDLFVH